MSKPLYRGSSKHKNRPVGGIKGTLCPEWTHTTPNGGLATDVNTHDWESTQAARLFATAHLDNATGRRYACKNGIAFEARPSSDGSWHGYPIPWESVPPKIKDEWLAAGKVKRRELKKHSQFERNDIHWALKTDDR